ncbi:hypothetical protein ABIB49_003897, partial [Arthrobacter sp. UYCu512]
CGKTRTGNPRMSLNPGFQSYVSPATTLHIV